MRNFMEEDIDFLASSIKRNFSPNDVFLVTGGTGYLGSLLVKALQRAGILKIYAVIRDLEKAKTIYSDNDRIEIVVQDLVKKINVESKIDYLVHTASPTTSRFFIQNPVETIESIVAGTKNVFEFAREKKVKSMVYLSSMEVFGAVDTNQKRGETELGYIDLENVRSSYSESKRLAELLCVSYAEEYGVPVSVARLSQVFGAGIFAWDNRVFKQFALSAIHGEDIVLHTLGDSYGNYTYSTDAIEAILTLLLRGEKGQTYNIANEENTMTIKEMATLVAENFSNNRSKVVIDIPKENMGYAPKTNLRLSSDKIKALGWTPKYNLKQMYERMIEGFKK